MSDLPDLRSFVRIEAPPQGKKLIVRGGPDSLTKLRAHAERVRRAFLLDGKLVLGISVFVAMDDIGPASFEAILASKLASYRLVHVVSVAAVVAERFRLLATFERPHMTLLLDDLDRLEILLGTLGPPRSNPQYGEMTRRMRRRPR